jgi:hypothetical protein
MLKCRMLYLVVAGIVLMFAQDAAAGPRRHHRRCICWAVEPTAGQTQAIAEIEKLGGKVTVDEKRPGKPVIEVDLASTEVTDAGLEPLRGLLHVIGLSLDNTHVTDTGLRHIEGLTQLVVLSLNKTQVTDAGMNRLQKLPLLRALSLDGTRITDVGLNRLRGLPQLVLLSVQNTGVTEEGVKSLRKALPNCDVIYDRGEVGRLLGRRTARSKDSRQQALRGRKVAARPRLAGASRGLLVE